MRFTDLRRAAQLYVGGMCVLALLQVAVAAWWATPRAPVELMVLLLLAATVAHCFPITAPGMRTFYVSLAFFMTGVLVLSPLEFATLIVLVHLADWIRARRSRFAHGFGAAALILAGFAARTTFLFLWPMDGLNLDLTESACLGAALTAALVFGLVNRAILSGARWLDDRSSPSEQPLLDRDGLLAEAIVLGLGALLAQVAVLAPWALAVVAAPLWLLHRVLDRPAVRARYRQDRLTELFTEAYLIEACTRELNRARRFNRTTVLLLLDVDGLSDLNAAHGHTAGDLALRETARAISRATREYDFPARLSGGLFAVLLPETDLAQAQAVAERVRRETAERRHEVPDSLEQARLTVSVGGCVLPDGNGSLTDLFKTARAALARAKQEGGNQIEFELVQPSLPSAAETTSLLNADSPIRKRPRHRPAPTGPEPTWRRVLRAIGLLLAAAAAPMLGAYVLQSVIPPEWRPLVVLVSLAGLAALGAYFKHLSVALTLAVEVHRSATRQWPRYLALVATGIVVAYAYHRFGLLGAGAVAGAAVLVMWLAAGYVDSTLRSVRKLRTVNEQLEHHAFHDPLTGLANRALFAERLEHAMLRAGTATAAVLFVDLDNFKSINDTLGHAAGDQLLRVAADRLRHCVRREDGIARLGGDEFTVLLEDMRDPSDAARLAERIGEAMRTPFEIDGQQARISSSVGIALDADRSHRPNDLLREADAAMYRAKSAGKSRYEIFDSTTGAQALERLELEADVRDATGRRELELWFEPIGNLGSGAVEGVAALVRWRHARRGMLTADEFLPIAEATGSIVELGEWVLRQACRAGVASPGVTVEAGVSARQLVEPGFRDMLARALDESGLEPRRLLLQVSESAVALGGEDVSTTLREVAELGVRLGLSDVAAGLLPLLTISQLPFEVLKLAPATLDSPVLVRATVALAAALGMVVAAPSVRDADQLGRLHALGVRVGQGELFGPPHSAEVVHVRRANRPEIRHAA